MSRLEVNFVHVQRGGTDKTSFIQSSIVANVKRGGSGYAGQRCLIDCSWRENSIRNSICMDWTENCS